MSKVLVVDDHAENRDLIVTLVKHAGHQPLEAEDGYLALEQVRAERPDLVICDILMPTMDGYEFVRRLRTEPAIAHTEVIFYTATFLEREARSLAASCGVSEVLVKPCEPEEILRVIEHSLTRGTVVAARPDETEFDREHLRLLTDKLALKVGELEGANRRLSALTDLNLQLASERDPYALLDKVCRGARELLGARFAILAVTDKSDDPSVRLATWGLSADQVEALRRGLRIDAGLPGRVTAEGRARRFFNPGGDPAHAGLEGHFPPVHCGLIAPIVALNRSYGWILLVDKLGADAFTDEDEHLLAIYAAQAGRIYQNGSLYKEIKRTADRLQIEIVERQRAAAELHQMNETLEQRVKQRTSELQDIIEGLESFNRSISHDLRGPLGGIAMAGRMARDFVAEDNKAKADRFLASIVTQAEITGSMVDSLLALARTSDIMLATTRVDMNALTAEVIKSIQQVTDKGPLPVVIRDLADVNADRDLVRQVLTNLIGNALKFSAEVPQPLVEVGMAEGTGAPLYFVRDNGVGFDPDQARNLFKPFQRLHGARFVGSGVGLSIVKRIVERHGGTLWAESTPGRGATFYFSFQEPGSQR